MAKATYGKSNVNSIPQLPNLFNGADVIDVRLLRESHNVCGLLLGTLPQVAQQNVFLGLPLQLAPEELASLLENGTHICIYGTQRCC